MKQDYLTPFLHHLSIKIPAPVSEYIASIGIQKGGEGEDDKPITIGATKSEPSTNSQPSTDSESKKTKLAKMIVNAIKLGLKKSDTYLQEKSKRANKIKVDIKKINRMTMANAIDLNYGGGILVFGPNFEIKKMIHMLYKEKKPVYVSKNVEDSMEDNVVNEMIQETQPYVSANITKEIESVIGESPN